MRWFAGPMMNWAPLGAEFSNDQAVAKLGVIKKVRCFFKAGGVRRVVVIGVVANVDVRRFDDVLDKAGRVIFVRKNDTGVGNHRHGDFLLGNKESGLRAVRSVKTARQAVLRSLRGRSFSLSEASGFYRRARPQERAAAECCIQVSFGRWFRAAVGAGAFPASRCADPGEIPGRSAPRPGREPRTALPRRRPLPAPNRALNSPSVGWAAIRGSNISSTQVPAEQVAERNGKTEGYFWRRKRAPAWRWEWRCAAAHPCLCS